MSQSRLPAEKNLKNSSFHVRVKQEGYKGWTILGQVDIDSFVDSHVTTATGFEENYKVVRTRRKEVDKLPETIKVCRTDHHDLLLFRVARRVVHGAN